MFLRNKTNTARIWNSKNSFGGYFVNNFESNFHNTKKKNFFQNLNLIFFLFFKYFENKFYMVKRELPAEKTLYSTCM